MEKILQNEMKAPDDKRLFTLTAEEVEDYIEAINTHIHWIHITKPKTEYWENEMNKYEEYLKRLKQWQDENNRTD